MRFIKTILFILTLFFGMGGCEHQPLVRVYEEQTIQSPLKSQMASLDMSAAAPQSSLPLSWNIPKGWTEEKGSGFRLASFKSTNAAAPIDGSIVTFPGQAGGLEVNIERWMKQIDLSPPPDLTAFIQKQLRIKATDGLEVIFFDFTALQTHSGADTPSMLAAILELHDQIVFIKLTGSKSVVIDNREAFKTLLRSLKIDQ